jgi:hypothetical protein
MDPVAGEVVHSYRRANRTQSDQRSVGGWLYFTNHRLAFHPHKFDAALAGEQWWMPWERIAGVGKEKKSLRAIQGGSLRDRLRIELDDGSIELFVINKLDTMIAEVHGYIA